MNGKKHRRKRTYICGLCGKQIGSGDSVDHIIPRKFADKYIDEDEWAAFSDTGANTIKTHRKCNERKGSILLSENELVRLSLMPVTMRDFCITHSEDMKEYREKYNYKEM